MKDIARELGVSVATVSRALKNSPSISEQQRDRIQAYAREHNFNPNIFGEALRLSRVRPAKVIGVIVPQVVHYYFGSVLSGIAEEARARGYNIMMGESFETYQRERELCEDFARNKVCGIIVSQAKDTTQYDHFERLLNSGIPIVFYDRICTGVDCSRVVVDDYMGAYTAVTHLIDTGCKRVAFYGTSMRLEIGKNRYNGYKDALLRHGMQVDEDLVRLCDNRAAAEALTPELLEGDDRPDAFFCVNDDTAVGVLFTAKRMGLKIPDDVSICGFTDGYRAISCDPQLTTVEQRGRNVGEEAANILIDQVEGSLPKNHAERRVVRTRLVVRGTTR